MKSIRKREGERREETWLTVGDAQVSKNGKKASYRRQEIERRGEESRFKSKSSRNTSQMASLAGSRIRNDSSEAAATRGLDIVAKPKEARQVPQRSEKGE